MRVITVHLDGGNDSPTPAKAFRARVDDTTEWSTFVRSVAGRLGFTATSPSTWPLIVDCTGAAISDTSELVDGEVVYVKPRNLAPALGRAMRFCRRVSTVTDAAAARAKQARQRAARRRARKDEEMAAKLQEEAFAATALSPVPAAVRSDGVAPVTSGAGGGGGVRLSYPPRGGHAATPRSRQSNIVVVDDSDSDMDLMASDSDGGGGNTDADADAALAARMQAEADEALARSIAAGAASPGFVTAASPYPAPATTSRTSSGNSTGTPTGLRRRNTPRRSGGGGSGSGGDAGNRGTSAQRSAAARRAAGDRARTMAQDAAYARRLHSAEQRNSLFSRPARSGSGRNTHSGSRRNRGPALATAAPGSALADDAAAMLALGAVGRGAGSRGGAGSAASLTDDLARRLQRLSVGAGMADMMAAGVPPYATSPSRSTSARRRAAAAERARARRVSGHAGVDVDAMGYDDLLQLAERIGSVARGARGVAALPTTTYVAPTASASGQAGGDNTFVGRRALGGVRCTCVAVPTWCVCARAFACQVPDLLARVRCR